jgi:5'-3' exonuclease
LIMLGLASHEPHFSLLREEVDFNSFRNEQRKNATKEVKKQVERDKWQLLHLSTLRQYIELEFGKIRVPFGFNLERVVDDWVFQVMLVGNDFLPHLPSLDIHEGALDSLASLYKELLPGLGGYLVEGGKPRWDRVEVLLRRLGEVEDEVLEMREEELAKRQSRGRGYVPPPPVASSDEDDFLEDDSERLADGNGDVGPPPRARAVALTPPPARRRPRARSTSPRSLAASGRTTGRSSA